MRGRVVKKHCLESERRWAYAYDSDNQLIQVECSGDPSGFKRIRFSYDALGRRTGRFDGRTQTLFVWDGLRLLREETGDRATTYFYEQGGYAPLARVDGRNAFVGTEGKADRVGPEVIYYYHCNVAGLPEDVTDSEGRVIWRGRYSTWGRLLYERTFPDTPKGFAQPLRMQGQYDDGDTGLYYNTFRYYDADAVKFSSEDPIGLMRGINLYWYAPNPFKWVDSLGLAYFAKRPLKGLPWLGSGSNNPLDDSLNTEISHEQLFFEDNVPGLPSNLGFFDDSTVKEDDVSLLNGYRRMPQQYDDAIMREAVRNVGSSMGEYKLLGNNCQVWAEKVRDEYFRLYSNKLNTRKVQ